MRKYDRVWQTTPIIENRLMALVYFSLTSGRLFGKPLKTSALSAMEMTAAPRSGRLFLKVASLLNTWLFKGKLHFQALGTNFRVWSDGIVSPLFEEMKSTSQLIAKEYDDVEGRQALLHVPDWVELFRKEWLHGRTGGDFASWKASKGFPDSLVVRDADRLIFDGAPVNNWDGESMAAVMAGCSVSRTVTRPRPVRRQGAFEEFPNLRDDADFMHMMRRYDKSFRFYADIANEGNRATLDYLLDEHALPGFNDSGAHITNMAFFDSNLMSLKLAKERDEATVARMVAANPGTATLFGLCRILAVGARADMVLINPNGLDGWEPDQTGGWNTGDCDHQQMVNRLRHRALSLHQGVWPGPMAGRSRPWTGNPGAGTAGGLGQTGVERSVDL